MDRETFITGFETSVSFLNDKIDLSLADPPLNTETTMGLMLYMFASGMTFERTVTGLERDSQAVARAGMTLAREAMGLV